jgi:LEA14-like dessication related protein
MPRLITDIFLRKIYLLLLVVLSSVYSCTSYEDVEIKDIRSVKLLKLDDRGLEVETEVKIHNPNRYDLKVTKSEFNVFVKNTRVGIARIDNKVKIKGNSDEYHKLILVSEHGDLSPTALPTLIAITAGGGNTIPFEVDGYIKGKVFLFTRKVEVRHKGNVPLKLF